MRINKSIDRTDESVVHPLYGEVVITRYVNNLQVYVKFTKTGSTLKCTYGNLINSRVKDYLHKSVADIGYLGSDCKDLKNKYPLIYKRIYEAWANMINRCHNINDTAYKYYGELGITVNPKWHDFCEFFRDFIKLPGYDEADLITGKLVFDRCKLCHNLPTKEIVHYKDTCCLITLIEQRNYSTDAKDFTVIHPDGNETTEHNVQLFSRMYKLGTASIRRCLTGDKTSHKGYKFKPISKV